MSDMLARLMALVAMQSGGADLSDYYTKAETDRHISDEVARIVSDAPEDFDTLRELSDWIATHEESAAAMNSAIQANTAGVAALYAEVSTKAPQSTTYTKTEVDTALAAKLNTADVDDALSSTSTNPVQNMIVKNAIDGKQDTLTTAQLAAVNSGITAEKLETIDTALSNKVDKETGKGLSTNDFTNAYKADLETALTKANAAAPQSTTYTKTEVDTALAAKVTLDNIYGTKPNIADGTDLNDMTYIGAYVCVGATSAASLVNCPTTTEAFILYVDYLAVSSRIIQRIYAFSTSTGIPAVYIRSKYSGGWSAWYKFTGTAVKNE